MNEPSEGKQPSTYADFVEHHLPNLFTYVVPILDGEVLNGQNGLGSGVLVNYHGRHIVATAKHCIEVHPRVFLCESRPKQDETVNMRELGIIRADWHISIDIGYLEIEDPQTNEMTADHLCEKQILQGIVHIIGHPETMAYADVANKEINVCGATFGTTLIEETDDFLRFDYPIVGSKFDPAIGKWMPSAFPETPRGFSGGGCFGVIEGNAGHVEYVEYKLLGIQKSWTPQRRCVEVIPIKHLCNLLTKGSLP